MRDSELVGMLARVVRSGETIKQSLKVSVANGRVFEIQAAPFSTSGGQGALAILYDMTDIERLEQVRKDFVANVSHEMRTPLASIVGYSETLLDGALEDLGNNRRFVEIIRSHAIRLNSIASDLLVLSELESGQDPGEPEVIQIGELLESAVATVEPEARSQGIRMLPRADRGRAGSRAPVPARTGAAEPARERREVQPGGRGSASGSPAELATGRFRSPSPTPA